MNENILHILQIKLSLLGEGPPCYCGLWCFPPIMYLCFNCLHIMNVIECVGGAPLCSQSEQGTDWDYCILNRIIVWINLKIMWYNLVPKIYTQPHSTYTIRSVVRASFKAILPIWPNWAPHLEGPHTGTMSRVLAAGTLLCSCHSGMESARRPRWAEHFYWIALFPSSLCPIWLEIRGPRNR